ncbi:MAG: hypothetical protein Ct9H300mP14_14310 [Gammaproteobacteria bacterium]|nr:MAG: hypothetical protein Ct9H300mP14_14310 [Gammaproteobacteria bacterium]
MDLVHEKTSFSPVISEAFDRSNGIYDPQSGEMIAQGELGYQYFSGDAVCYPGCAGTTSGP